MAADLDKANNEIEYWKNKVGNWGNGVPPGRNSMLNKAAFALGMLGANDLISIEQALAALMDACKQNGLYAEDGEDSCEATFESGWNAGLSHPREFSDNMQSFSPFLRRYQEDWWVRKTNGSWELESDETIETFIRNALDGEQWESRDKDGNRKLETIWTTNTLVREVIGAMKAITKISDKRMPPFWLDDAAHDDSLYPANEIVVFQNGMLHWPSRYFSGHDQRLFTTVSLPFEYDPDAECPEWEEFLTDLFPEDEGEKRLLKEIFGYVLTNQVDLQKLFLIIGPPRSGKSTIGNILRDLVGKPNTATLSLSDLSNNFALEGLIGKQFNLCSDTRIKGDESKAIQKLLAISGGDPQSVDRKFKVRRDHELRTNFLIVSNNLPEMRDPSGAIATRFVPLKIRVKGWLGKEDVELPARLRAELPGIFNWALEGAFNILERKKFDLPESSKHVVKELAEGSAPLSVFLQNKCVLDEEGFVTREDIYKAYKQWANVEGHTTNISKIKVLRDIRSQYPFLDEKQKAPGWGFIGLRLLDPAVDNPWSEL